MIRSNTMKTLPVTGHIEMIDKNTLSVHLDPNQELDDDQDSDENLMMKLFLDSLLKFAIAKPDSLTPYTQQMADKMDDLLAGVVLDKDENYL
jgi:antitoxin PrlF